MKTKEAIEVLMVKMYAWKMFDGLSKSEIQSIKIDLEHLAGTAIMESHNKVQNILPDFYNEITKG